MSNAIMGAVLVGIDAQPVQIEVKRLSGVSPIEIRGMSEVVARHAQARILDALGSAGYYPEKPYCVNVNGVDTTVIDNNASLDLPIALALLQALGHLPQLPVDILAVGELTLSGLLRGEHGVFAITQLATREARVVVCPTFNASQAIAAAGMVCHGSTLKQVVHNLTHGWRDPRTPFDVIKRDRWSGPAPDWSDIRGQKKAQEALEIAAIGGFSALMLGTPGTGKTMLARRFPGILPPLTYSEAAQVTNALSASGLLPPGVAIATERPFRAPHYTTSSQALVGSETHPVGEATLASGGVLYLDELPEFTRGSLDTLYAAFRQRSWTIQRGQMSVSVPTDFMLLAASNTCPCGRMPEACACSASAKAAFMVRLAEYAPHFQLVVRLEPLEASSLQCAPSKDSTADVQARVIAARALLGTMPHATTVAARVAQCVAARDGRMSITKADEASAARLVNDL